MSGGAALLCHLGKSFVTRHTLTSLRIAENETKGNGLVLFLVPSIALLGQALREWAADAKELINAICICSDSKVTKKKINNDDTDLVSIVDLALPASTNVKSIVKQISKVRAENKKGLTVIYSTYQSIDVVADAQKEWLKFSTRTSESRE